MTSDEVFPPLGMDSGLDSVSPTAGGQLQIPLRRQQGQHLCWAALAASLLDYYAPDACRSQREVAHRVIGGGPIDQRCRLDVTLESLGLLDKVQERRVGFAELRSEIDAGRPLCAAIRWKATGNTHFLLLHGYQVRRNVQILLLGDPRFGYDRHEYEYFPKDYQLGGEWTWTYWTRPPQRDKTLDEANSTPAITASPNAPQ